MFSGSVNQILGLRTRENAAQPSYRRVEVIKRSSKKSGGSSESVVTLPWSAQISSSEAATR